MSNAFDESLTGATYDGVEMKTDPTGYRIVLGLSVGSVVFGLISGLAFLAWSMLLIPVVGLSLAMIAIWRILKAPDELGGFYMAVAGGALSTLLGLGCLGWLLWDYYGSIPVGYEYVDFNEMVLTPDRKLPEKIIRLGRERRKVFIKGYMYQGRRLQGITDFIMVRTQAHCKFCSPEQNPTDMIDVTLVGDLKVAYRTRPVRVGGTLYVNENYAYGELPYLLVADVFR
ncbi:MAG TPA: hypothetical protein DEB39_08335 [Planctomycetaceae bacterium]|nr:hypothetical protein [Planctomycetaceae bacterium]